MTLAGRPQGGVFSNGQRRCSRCHEWKPLIQFYQNPHMAGGVNSACKACISKYNKNKATLPTKVKPLIVKPPSPLKVQQINPHEISLTEGNLSICRVCINGCTQGRGCQFLKSGHKQFKLAKQTDKGYFREWYLNNKHLHKKKYAEYLAANSEKLNAWIIVTKMMESGELVKPDYCSHCGKERFVEAHHPDYSEPRKVSWLCRSCHRKTHRNGL